MRNAGFFPRLALVNLARNGRFYGPYLLSCGAVAAMYYILRFLTWHEALTTVRGAAYLQVMMSIGCFVVSLFSAVILLYANSFVMKRRQRELGIYNILGLEKRHIAAMCFWETLYCAAAAILGGVLAGVLLSRGMLWCVAALLRLPVEIRFSVSGKGIGETAALFGGLFFLTLAANLLRVGRARPVELLRSGAAGEREPKTKRLLTAVGILALGAGYVIALTTEDPVEALLLFFVAVLLVMLGTYCLFTAGSVALLKRLRADRGFYYQTRHFTAVSGLLYRMKQNAVGLANICILSSMVLVTVSGTACLYLGMEDALDRAYPHDIQVIQDLDRQPGDPAVTLETVQAALASAGAQVDALGWYTGVSFSGGYGGNTLSFQAESGTGVQVELVTAKDYGRLTGREIALAGGEVLAWAEGLTLPETFYIEDQPLRVVERLDSFAAQSGTAMVSGSVTLGLVAEEETLERIAAPAPERSRRFRVQIDLSGADGEKLAWAEALLAASDGTFSVNSRQDNARDLYAMYGGFLFTGLFLGALFLLATVLIIYYKQISEGYEDQRRYRIMGQVGMSPREIRASINSQVLLVFFLPLAAAGLHILAAFRMLCRILELFGLTNVGLFALCTAGSLLVFGGIYALVFALTARTYGRIVGGSL
ncbi:MAG: ABC transporter permease [Oscillospiraceae bacterium]|nr:ABC transporter permease [Oscillospiraceae bacterium]